MDQASLPLRILYTINSSPQYILARSSTQVAVSPIPGTSSTPNFQYATTSLKTCLDCICRSSPELLQDTSRDFSVYVLDPLESNSAPAQVTLASSLLDPSPPRSSALPTEPSRGVAVGLGLMSWALRADEKDVLQVNGSLIKLGTGQPALEVIFALRETATIQKASFPEAIRSWSLPTDASASSHRSSSGSNVPASSTSTPHYRSQAADISTMATIASIQMRAQHKRVKQKKHVKPPAPKSEADRLMMTDDIYIGPVKKKGRPAKLLNGSNIESGPGAPTTSEHPVSDVTSHSKLNDQGKKMPRLLGWELKDSTSALTSASESNTVLDVLAYLSASGGDPTAALLTAFNAIDSTAAASSSSSSSVQSPSPALVNALKGLLTAIAEQQTVPSRDPSSQQNVHQLADDEIVLLDKENINPSAFRKRSNNVKEETSPSLVRYTLGSSLSNALPTANPEDSSHSTIIVPVTPKTTINSSRKRRLSDFMDEREAQRNKGKAKESGNRDRRNPHRHDQPLSSARHYPRVMSNYPRKKPGTNCYYRTGLEPWTSPVKLPANQPSTSKDENSREKPIVIPDSPQTTRNIASSPIRSKPVPMRKPYIVPQWARTETATQPRLSDQAQKALKQKEEEKRKEILAKRRRPDVVLEEVKQKQEKVKVTAKGKEERERFGREHATVQRVSPKSIDASCPPRPIAASDDCLVFPITSFDDLPFVAPSTPKRVPLPCPLADALIQLTPTAQAVAPCTPPRKRQDSLFSPDGDFSLFTPQPRSCKSISMASLNTRPMPSTPSPTKKKGGKIDSSSDHVTTEDDLDILVCELDGALEELDLPSDPSSIPSINLEIDQGDEDDMDERPSKVTIKQHWVGLPPSSPPPPSSPLLAPQDEESDVDDHELPVASSEAGDYPFQSGEDCRSFCWDTSNMDDPGTPQSLAHLFPPLGHDQTNLDSNPTCPDSGTGVFDAFVARPRPSDDSVLTSLGDTDLPSDAFQQGLMDFDFNELWETFKPLVEQTANNKEGNGMPELGVDFGQLDDFSIHLDLMKDIDPQKLAEDVQALFSGCIV